MRIISFPIRLMIIARKNQPKMYRKFNIKAFTKTESASFVTQKFSSMVELATIDDLVSSRIVQTVAETCDGSMASQSVMRLVISGKNVHKPLLVLKMQNCMKQIVRVFRRWGCLNNGAV